MDDLRAIDHAGPIPPDDLLERISGWREPWLFDAQGRATRRDWELALAAIGKQWTDFTRVLDFGCGPGRVVRYFRDLTPELHIMGVDTDQEAIEWAGRHLPWAEFRPVRSLPPIAMPEHSFDLILSHSVMTHMPEHVQDVWLSELSRVMRPDALALLTVNGEHAVCHLEKEWRKVGADPTSLRETFDSAGLLYIADDSWNDEKFRPHFPDYYHSAFHSASYVQRHWGRFFSVKAILFRAALDWQDIVVLGQL